MTDRVDLELAEQLDRLAGRVTHNGMRRTDPERFHAEKSDIAASLRKLAKKCRGEVGRREHSTTWRNPRAR